MQSFGSEDIKDEVDVCNVATITRRVDHKFDVTASVRNLHSVIPVPSEFDSKYSNPCWHSHLNLEPAWTISKLRSARREHSMTESLEQELIEQIEGVSSAGDNATSLVCLPGVFVPGFPKSGSTQLWRTITAHPLMVRGRSKEPHWWTRFPIGTNEPFNKLSVFAYLKHFARGSKCSEVYSSQCLTVDASQSLIWDSFQSNNVCYLPRILQAVVPGAKFVVIMRDPLRRLYSEYWYFSEEPDGNRTGLSNQHFHKCAKMAIDKFRTCLKTHSLPTCVHKHNLSPSVGQPCGQNLRLAVGVYYVYIRQWMKFFSSENFLFLRLEDFSHDPFQVLTRVWDFLGLPFHNSTRLDHAINRHSLKRSYPDMLPGTERLLRRFYSPYNAELAKLLKDDDFTW